MKNDKLRVQASTGIGHWPLVIGHWSGVTHSSLCRAWLIGVHLWLFALFVFAALAGAQEVQVTATVGSDVVGVEDNFQLTVTVTGKDSGQAETPRLPRLRGLLVVSGPSVSTQFQWINGVSSQSKGFIYVLLPEKEGQITIDPIQVTVGGKIFKTQPMSVRVIPGSHGPRRSFDPFGEDIFRAPRSAPADNLFVAAELDRSSAYPGQQVTLAYHLYTQVGVTGLQIKESPPLTGFWVEDIPVGPSPTATRRTVNGKEYLDYVIKKQALFPNTPGKLKIAPSTFAVSVKLAGDLLGLFGQSETVYKKTREIILDVKPFPSQDRPADFSNAVGSFSLTSSLDKTEAATGDAVGLHVNLAGRGNLKTIADLPLPPMPDFTIYSSKRAENVRPVEGDIIGGEKSWEYVIVPKAPGRQKIPSFSFSFFDPEQGRYRILTAPPLELHVVRGSNAADAVTGLSGAGKQSLTRQASDINFIKLSANDLETRSDPIYRSAWFYVLAGVPLLFNIGAFLYQRERSRETGDAVLARSRRARRTALARLKNAEKSGRGEPRKFYDETALALSGYLTGKFNLPAIAMTGDMLEKTLAEHSLNPDTVREILACLQECDFGRFVSASASKEKMQQLAARVRQLIDALERL